MKLIHKFKSLNFDKRNIKEISFVIIHYTALPSIENSIEKTLEIKENRTKDLQGNSDTVKCAKAVLNNI